MFVVFDLETTGLTEMTHDIIQFAYAMFDSNNTFVKAETLYFYYEGMNWSEEAYQVHKISKEFLREHKDEFRQNLIKMYSVLNRANVVGHNCKRFDCPFVRTWLARMGLPGLEFSLISDSMLFSKPITKRPRIKLVTLSEMMGLTPELISNMASQWFNIKNDSHAHNAAYDVTATALITLIAISKKLVTPDTTIAELLSQNDNEDDAISDLMSFDTFDLKPDPSMFIVSVETENGISYIAVNHDKEKYKTISVTEDMVKGYTERNLVFPYTLSEESDNVYSSIFDGVTYTLTVEQEYDTFTIDNVWCKLQDTAVNMQSIIANLRKESKP